MKKTLLWAVLFISFAIYSYGGDKKMKFNDLPKNAQNFYTQHFGNNKIKDIEYDREDKKYEIELWNQYKIKFDQRGQWVEVDGDKDNAIPSSIMDELPIMVRNKILRHHTGKVVEVKRNLHNPSNIIYKISVFHDANSTSPTTIVLDSSGKTV